MRRHTALVVDGDIPVRESARDAFSSLGLSVRFVDRVDEALTALSESGASVVLVDPRGAGASPETFLAQVLRARPEAVAIVIGAPDAAEALLDAGAFEVVPRTPTRERLQRAVERALRHHERLLDLARLRAGMDGRAPLPPLVGRSEAMNACRERLGEVAASEEPVLLVGENGSGRTLAARFLHAMSARGGAPFVRVDVRADGTAVERIEGAADDARAGVLYVAGIDRLAEPPQRDGVAALVAKLRSAGVRIVCSAGREADGGVLAAAPDAGPVDAPGTSVIRIPPLRERGRDAVILAHYFVEGIRRKNHLPPTRISPEALNVFEAHTWPGNVEELMEAVAHAMTMATRGAIHVDHLPDSVRRAVAHSGAGNARGRERRFREAKRRIVDSFERSYLEELLAWHGGNVTTAAEQAGMLRSALQRLLRKHALRSEEFRQPGNRRPPIDA